MVLDLGILLIIFNPGSDFFYLPVLILQARLNEIITSVTKTVHNNGASPWMDDGAGLPSNSSELLPKMVITFSK